ncbi:hypothetical protein HYH02_008113 [Chlamydomonas schloesseri]|uniref:DUF7811 domain-containing protein n=1 Tax=Chlamydomonas schloesseri TaxID=2026947 RepID=A0A835WGS5_9CHLO|nr:hypothetical protein HYH02_008113 [Chlamydomonas schloesseri]|eukprot:KAG2446959.1 hypothetical protein HYH02_008113 [Chlamydomonas schloesseri]
MSAKALFYRPCSLKQAQLRASTRRGFGQSIVCRARRSHEEDDVAGPKEYVREVITFVTSDGVVQIPGRRVARPAPQHKKLVAPMPTWEEQSLCIGATFSVAATNGMEPGRRVSIEGFCQSVDYLFASVQDALESELGGEVLMQERQLKSGLHEVLKLTVAVPLLFGVPPQLDVLNEAIRSGGGIVDRVRHVWLIHQA